MKTALQVVFHGIAPSPALEAAAREKAHRLERFSADILSCRVDIDESHKHQHQGRPFGVRIHLSVPGEELTVDRVADEDVYVALRDAFDATKRQLEEVVREQRGDVKVHEPPQHGKVARLLTDEGYGFIVTADGRELYFSRENVVHPGFDDLQPGTAVQFIEELADSGPQAKRVSVGKHQV